MSVLIVNAQLQRIDIGTPDAAGDVTYAQGAALEVDATIDEPTRSQKFGLGALTKDVTAVLYVMKDDLPEGTQLQEGYRVTAQQEGEAAATTYVVLKRNFRSFGEMTHFELFLKEM